MLNQKLEEALNRQINMEFYSSYLYLSMAAYCETINLPGFAHWMRLQSQEEQSHGLKTFDYINDRNGRVMLLPIAQPAVEFQSVLDVMQQTLAHEREVTQMFNQLYGLAIQEGDPATQVYLQWFITEQVEEEKTADAVIEQLKMIGDQGDALLLLDREMAARQLAAA